MFKRQAGNVRTRPWKGGVQVCRDTNECVYVCLTSPSHWNSLRTQYHIVVEGTQSPVYRNGTPVRVILRIRRQTVGVSGTRRKGIKNKHISCVSCLLCYLDAFHARYTRKVDMACLVALNVSLRYTTCLRRSQRTTTQ